MSLRVLLAFLALHSVVFVSHSLAAELPPAAHDDPGTNGFSSVEARNWEIDFETGILWRAGHNGTHLNYVLLPQILTLKTPPVMRRPLAGGVLLLRSRFSLLHASIIKGPENHFTGVTAAGIFEWWNAAGNFSLYFSSGGGVGWLDSKGYEVPDAQGQDFNFTWFLYPGMRYRWSQKASVALGVYYQHVSNRGLDKINPGLDAVGPLLSLGWHF